MTKIYSTENLSVTLYEPRIPQNTGNIARTCAAFKLPLHLIEPLGFSIEDKYLKRAGLDYWPYVDVTLHQNFELFYKSKNHNNRLIGFSKSSKSSLTQFKFKLGDILMFGREDNGMPYNVQAKCDHLISIPMPGISLADGTGGIRSLNLSSAVSICVYQAASQLKLL